MLRTKHQRGNTNSSSSLWTRIAPGCYQEKKCYISSFSLHTCAEIQASRVSQTHATVKGLKLWKYLEAGICTHGPSTETKRITFYSTAQMCWDIWALVIPDDLFIMKRIIFRHIFNSFPRFSLFQLAQCDAQKSWRFRCYHTLQRHTACANLKDQRNPTRPKNWIKIKSCQVFNIIMDLNDQIF